MISSNFIQEKEIEMLNKVLLIGRLGADPEVRYTPDGMMVANFNIATSEYRKDKNGERIQKTEWHRTVTFGKLAEICSSYLSKGKLVFIEGRIQSRSWEDKDGNKRTTTEIVANNMQMLDTKPSAKGKDVSEDDHVPAYSGMDQAPEEDVPF